MKKTSKQMIDEIKAAHELEFDTHGDDMRKCLRQMHEFVDAAVAEGFTRSEAISMIVQMGK